MASNAETALGTSERINYLLSRPVLSIHDTAELFDLSRSTIRRAIAAGNLPARHVGRRVLIPTATALAWAGVGTNGGAS